MRWSLSNFLVLLVACDAVAADKPATPPIVPSIVYRDHVFVHYHNLNARNKPYVIVVKPLNNYAISTTFDVANARNGLGSLFVRGNVLVVGENDEWPLGIGQVISIDSVGYFSADRICDAKWIPVEPDGEAVKVVQGSDPKMWSRKTERFIQLKAGDTEISHTAVAASGERNLLVFDLIKTTPSKDAAPKFHIAVTRVTPEMKVRLDGWTNRGRAEEKPIEDVPSEFSEPFQAYLIGDDYYFLTRSGSVYLAASPEKGKSRTMKGIWTDPASRIAYIISDGERTGVHFLIPARDKIGWGYFRLGPTPKLQFLSANRPYPDDMEPAEIVRELTQLLKMRKEIPASK
ncbi:MAG: hypothetical protein K8U57_40150 [Planctomycetes bacterium]|nr:hypothetical protein [Planctomycetota bacterium]